MANSISILVFKNKYMFIRFQVFPKPQEFSFYSFDIYVNKLTKIGKNVNYSTQIKHISMA